MSSLQDGQQRTKRKKGWETCQGWKLWSRKHTTDFTATRAWMNISPSLKRTRSVRLTLPPGLMDREQHFTTKGGIASTSTGAKSPNCWSTRLAKTFRLCHRGEHKTLAKLFSSASGPLSASSTWAFSGVPKVASCLLREKSSNKKSLSLFVLSEEEMDEAFCRDVESFSPAYTPRIKIQGWEEGISQLEMINVRTEGGVHTFIIHVLFGQVFVRTERETRQLPYNPYTSLRIAVWQVMLYLFQDMTPNYFLMTLLWWLHNFPCSVALAPPPAGGWKYLMESRNPWVIGPQTTNTGNWWTRRILNHRLW